MILGINFKIKTAVKADGINKIENKSQGALIGTIEINNKKLENIISNASIFFSIFLSDKIPNTITGRLIAAKKYSSLSIVIKNNINPKEIDITLTICFFVKLLLKT